jgi:hypothetical protein
MQNDEKVFEEKRFCLPPIGRTTWSHREAIAPSRSPSCSPDRGADCIRKEKQKTHEDRIEYPSNYHVTGPL